MKQYSTELLFRPESAEHRFLPEGPYPAGEGKLSWISIQHGADAVVGAVHVLDLNSGSNQAFDLDGRPGFAFPTINEGEFVVGLERNIQVINTQTGEATAISETVDADVEGTIVNDGVTFDGNLVFGAKDLKFEEKKAGLYLWRASDKTLIKLRDDQVCSNGKVVTKTGDNTYTLLDIDTPTKQVVRYELDVAAGTLSEATVVVDLTSRDDFPDGMVGTPDGKSVIIGFYNPNDVDHGEAVQFSLDDGSVEAVWKTEKSPKVTCPQLVRHNGAIKLVLTTAVEGMTDEQLAQHTNAGCLFIGDTDFTDVPPTPPFGE